MERSQLIVQPDDSVKFTLVAFESVRTAAAIFALVKSHGSPLLVSFHWLCSEEEKFLVIWTNQPPFFIYPEIYSAVFLVLAFLFVHWKFHVLLHAVSFTIQVMIQISIARVCYRYLEYLWYLLWNSSISG